jgi:hypothetical protein
MGLEIAARCADSHDQVPSQHCRYAWLDTLLENDARTTKPSKTKYALNGPSTYVALHSVAGIISRALGPDDFTGNRNGGLKNHKS